MKPSDYPIHLTSQEAKICIDGLTELIKTTKNQFYGERDGTLDEYETIDRAKELIEKLEASRR